MINLFKNFISSNSVEGIKDLIALNHLSPILSSLKYPVPWTRMSISPCVMMTILNDIKINQRKHIVEMGAGWSTIILAKYIEQLHANIELTSIDEDAHFVEVIESILKDNKLKHNILNLPSIKENERVYYQIEKEELKNQIDCLIVDGPNTSNTSDVERGINENLLNLLSDNFSIFIDDAKSFKSKRLIEEIESYTKTQATVLYDQVAYFTNNSNRYIHI